MHKGLMLGALALVAAAVPAQAATVFSSRTAFNAAGSGTSTFTALDGAYAGNTLAPFAVGSLAFSGNTLYVTAANTTAGANGAPNASDWVQVRLDTGGSTSTITAPSFQLIGFDIRPYADAVNADVGETVRFTANTGETGTFLTPATNTTGFFGVAFSTQVTSVTFSAVNGGTDGFYTWFGTDNYQLWSQAAGVPEPASWAMMIAGVALVGGSLRRRAAKVAFA